MIMSGFTILNVKASANDSESVISHRGLTSGQLRHAKFGTLRRFSKNRQAPRGPDHIAVPVPASACSTRWVSRRLSVPAAYQAAELLSPDASGSSFIAFMANLFRFPPI